VAILNVVQERGGWASRGKKGRKGKKSEKEEKEGKGGGKKSVRGRKGVRIGKCMLAKGCRKKMTSQRVTER